MTPRFWPNNGRANDVIVAVTNPFGPITRVFVEPAYLVSLSNATEGQKVECVSPAAQKVRVKVRLVSCILGWPVSTRSGILIKRLLGNRRFLSPLC